MAKTLTTPLAPDVLAELKAGDELLLNGTVYTARDAAHHRLAELCQRGQPLPLGLEGEVIYYVGPTPASPGRATGSAGPTTSSRMDAYTPALLDCGVKAVIGKGDRSPVVIEALRRHGAVYLAAVGGAGALLAERIKTATVVAYPELGPEAIYRLEIEAFPVIVVVDVHGGNLYVSGRESYRRQ